MNHLIPYHRIQEEMMIISLNPKQLMIFIHHPQIKYFPNEEFLQLFKLFNQFHPN